MIPIKMDVVRFRVTVYYYSATYNQINLHTTQRANDLSKSEDSVTINLWSYLPTITAFIHKHQVWLYNQR